MKKKVIKAAAVCVLSASLVTGYGLEVNAAALGDTSAAGVTAALDKLGEIPPEQGGSEPVKAGITAALDSYYENSTGDGEAVAAEIASLTKKEIVSVVKGYTKLGVANVDNYLNVREEPNEEGELVGKLPQSAGCEVLEEVDGWFRVKSGKVEGYVRADYLLTGEAANAKAEEVRKMVATVNTTTLFMRSEPTTESEIMTMLGIEEEIEVIEDLGDWAKVQVDADEGYISKDYVDISYELPKGVTVTELKYGQGVSNVRVDVVEYAKQFLGNPYVWGGTSLTNGADCSGFTLSVLAKYGVSLPRTSAAQSTAGAPVDMGNLLPGDLIFYGNGSSVNHVAMYIGGGQVIHASTPKTGIKISNMNYRTPLRARRFLG